MKTRFLFASVLLLSRVSHAQLTITNSLTATNPTLQQTLQATGTASTCIAPRAFPGLVTLPPNQAFLYATHRISNAAASPACLTFSLTSACSQSVAFLMLTVYSSSFDPTNLATNYRGDIGLYIGQNITQSCSIEAAAGESLVLVVSSRVSLQPCSQYTITVTPSGGLLPVTKATLAIEALHASPTPATSTITLHGPLGRPYQLLNLPGQVVHTGTVTNQAVDIRALPGGLYLLRDAVTGLTSKVVKQ